MLKGPTVIVVIQVQAKADVAVGLWFGSSQKAFATLGTPSWIVQNTSSI